MHPLDKDKQINKWVGISLAAHLLMAGLLGWINTPSRTKKEFYTPVYKVNLVTPERPKKKVARKRVKAKRPAAAKPAKKKKTKTAPKKKPSASAPVKAKAVKKSTTAAIDPSAAIAALRKKQEAAVAVEKIKERLADEEEDKVLPDHKAATKDIGPETPQGVKKVSLSDMDKAMKKYYDSLWEKIQAVWALPGSGSFEGMTAIISATIGRGGMLISASIEEGSGNGFYDQSTLRAVKKAAPFEPLPEGYEGGLEVGFRFKL
ncbi:MAG: cell envelope integrity protein TolA [Proteobacteria bacterium]|nr:cell envelope integrity protein TolA [Pseudomonadota bacterium]